METFQLQKIEDLPIVLAPEAVALKASALKQAEGIKKVEDEFSNQLAADALVSLQRILSGTEKGREWAKAPVLKLGKKIDGMARDFTKQCEDEKKRIQGLIAPYAAAILKAAQEAEAKRQLEARKLAEKAAAAKTPEKRIAIEEKINAINNAPAVATQKTEGASSREVWRFEVTSMDSLYLANPRLCSLEPNTAAINRELAAGVRSIPGLRIYSEIMIVARS